MELRYNNLFKEVPELLKSDLNFCRASLLSQIDQSEEEVMQEILQECSQQLKQISIHFQKVPNPARKEIWIEHFIEQVAFTVVGLDNVGKFLQDLAQC